MVGPKGGFALLLIMTVTKAEHLLTIVDLGAAPDAATVFPKHPHVEGRVTVILEMEGAPPAQATRAGKRTPTAGQIARGGDFDCNLRSPAAATVCLQPEPAWTGGQRLIGKEAGQLEPGAGRILRPDNELRQHL